MSSLNSEAICKAFDSMALKQIGFKSYTEDQLMELSSKYRCSFINGKWSTNMLTPGFHCEDNPMDKPYWKNETAVWASLSCFHRAQHLEKVAKVLESESSKLIDIEAALHSISPTKLATEIIPHLAQYVRYYANWAALPSSMQYKPKGCVAVDVRCASFPLQEAVWAAAPALAVGNTVNILVCEPRFQSLLHLAQQCFAAGLPAGSINVILTPDANTPSLANVCKGPATVFAPFQSAKNAGVSEFVQHGNCQFSLFGHSHMLVLRHADVEAAVQALIHEAYLKRKLTNWPLSEVLIEEHLYADFTSCLKAKLSSFDSSSVPSPNAEEREWIVDMILLSEIQNLELISKKNVPPVILLGGRAPEPSTSWEIESKLRPICVLPIRSHTEAVNMVNSRPRTLSASVWTEEGSLAFQVASSLKVGLVWINQHGSLLHPAAGFSNWNVGGGVQFGGEQALMSQVQCESSISNKRVVLKTRKFEKGETSTATQLNMYWGGETHKGSQGCFIMSSKDKILAQTSFASQKDAESVVTVALKSVPSWVAQGLNGRASNLRALAEALKDQEDYFALLFPDEETLARDDIQAAVDVIYKWIYYAYRVQGIIVGDGKPGSFSMTRHELGVVAVLGDGPTFTSLTSLMNLLACALVFGNTVVLSAAGSNPAPALLIAQALLLCAPMPHGTVNVLSSGLDQVLAAHPDVAAVWVGNSTATLASATFKRVWRLQDNTDYFKCPEEWLLYEATKQKTIAI